MTMYKPNIQVSNLSIFRDGRSVFDEEFHSGLNIIRGENSSGKSTIMDFLFYGMGGDLLENEWREIALLCDTVYVGLHVNGSPITVTREIDPKSSQPMRIFIGEWEEAMSAGPTGWERYPYRRGDKESFSQVIFRFLGLPEVEYENQKTKLTMNQILRLLYADQLSSVDKIFRSLSFDDALTRQSIGDLLFGGYSHSYYTSKIRKREVEAELNDISRRKTLLIRAHASSGHPLTTEWLDQEQSEANKKLEDLNSAIEALEETLFSASGDDGFSLREQNSAADRVSELQQKIAVETEAIRELEFEIADSEAYVSTLEKKISQIRESSATISQFVNLSFEFCPACLATLNENATDGACQLCKTPYDPDLTHKRSLRLLNDYERQLEQSNHLQKLRNEEVSERRVTLAATVALWEDATAQFQATLRTPSSENRLKLRRLNREIGRTERELEEIAERRSVVEELSQLSQSMSKLEEERDRLGTIIETEARRTQEQLSRARRKVEIEVLDFLERDLNRQSTFQEAERFSFEFDGDRMSVNGESFFSASSMVYMRNSFFASCLFAAADDPTFMHPRFLMMDTIEDKGMEMKRSQNFQKLLAEKSSVAKSSHQLIIATSMIAPELDQEKYVVGERYSHENKTLEIQSGK